MSNYSEFPGFILAPVIAYIGAILVVVSAFLDKPIASFLSSSLVQIGTILTAGFSLFPFIMPSSTRPDSSLTIWDATSSHLTLQLMFWAVVIFLPIIIAYTSWVYRVMRGTVSEKDIEKDAHSYY